MTTYKVLLRHILANGIEKADRTGVGTRSVFGYQMRFNLSDGFPLLTTKELNIKCIIHELLWFLMGSTNIKYLNDNGVHIWDAWADKSGELGPVYGKQWREWSSSGGRTPVDQISGVIQLIKTDPNSRRLVVTAWRPDQIHDMALPPCPCLFQFYVADGKLSCHVYQRSADVFLGLPFDIAQYALLTMMVAQVCDLRIGELLWSGTEIHLYKNHFEQAVTQLSRSPEALPKMCLNPGITDIFDFKYTDFLLINYKPHPAIKAPIAV